MIWAINKTIVEDVFIYTVIWDNIVGLGNLSSNANGNAIEQNKACPKNVIIPSNKMDNLLLHLFSQMLCEDVQYIL